jgi:hypothetical protein
MNQISNALSDWLPMIAAFACIAAYFAITSRWEAYTRRKNYEELKILNDLREKSIITQEEFDEKKEVLLNV